MLLIKCYFKMPRTSTLDPNEAMSLLFKGCSLRTAGAVLGVDKGTVKTVYKKFLERAEEVSLLVAAKEYKVENEVKALMKLGDQIETAHLDWSQVEDSITVADALKKLDVKPKTVTSFVNEVMKESKEQHLDPRLFVETAYAMYQNQASTGKTYREQAEDSTNLVQKISDSNRRVEELNQENQQLEADNKTLFNKNKTDADEVSRFTATRTKLKGYGCDISDLDELSTLLGNVKAKGYDTKRLLDFYFQDVDLDKRHRVTSEDLEGKQTDIAKKEAWLKELDDKIDKARAALSLNQTTVE
jgi:transposase-like protein